MATHSSVLAWRIPWTEGAWRATVCRVAKSWTWLKWISTQRVNVLVSQLTLTLCDPMYWSPQSFSVHVILQARILGWVTIPSPGNRPNPGMEPGSSALQWILYRGQDGWIASPTQKTWVEQTLGDSERQGSLMCCSSRGHKEPDTT